MTSVGACPSGGRHTLARKVTPSRMVIGTLRSYTCFIDLSSLRTPGEQRLAGCRDRCRAGSSWDQAEGPPTGAWASPDGGADGDAAIDVADGGRRLTRPCRRHPARTPWSAANLG